MLYIVGFVPRLDILDLICTISCNYCSSYLLSKLMSSAQRNGGLVCCASACSCQDWQLHDVIMFVSETSESLSTIICIDAVSSLTCSCQLVSISAVI